jgi:hypothetical protein
MASTAACAKPLGNSPFSRRASSAANSGCAALYDATRARHAASASTPAALASQAEYAASGTTKGSCGQARAARVAWISSAPSGSPCALALPLRVGAPLPMLVRQTTSVGRVALFLACAMAASSAFTSWPSTGPMTCQP